MDEYYFSAPMPGGKMLCLAPLTDRRIANADIEVVDCSGLFLYEQEGSGDGASIKIMAQILSEDAALQLREFFKMD